MNIKKVNKEQYQVIIKVHEVKGTCPIFKKGDQFVIDKYAMPVDKITPQKLCYHALCALYGTVMQVRGDITNSIFAQCQDPGPGYGPDNGGTVVFKLSQGEKL